MALDTISKLSMKGVPGEGHDTFEFKPELTSKPTAPEPDISIYNGFEVVNTTSNVDGNAATDGARVPPHTPEWTNFNSSDPGLLLPAVQDLLSSAVQHDFDLT